MIINLKYWIRKFAVIIGLNPSKTARSPILWNAAFKANNQFSMIRMMLKKNLDMVLNFKQINKFIGGSH